MSAERGSRLAIAAILLSFQTVFFIFEYIKPFKKIAERGTRWKDSIRRLQYFFPFGFGVLGVILVPLMLSRKNDDLCSEHRKIDADIGGPGIRFAIWAQEIVLIVICIIGTFHNKATGVKEIGAGLGITHISLAIALLVEMTKKREKGKHVSQLGPADAILGSMILDSQNIALSIPLVTKETLASRWQVAAIVLCQGLGLVLLAILVQFFGTGVFRTDPTTSDCQCVSVVWWGWLSNCSDGSSAEMDVFWIYYACRCLIFFQSSFHAFANMSEFHDAEKKKTPLQDITFPGLVKEDLPWYEHIQKWVKVGQYKGNPSPYDLYPSTVSLMYVVYGVFSLASLAAAETAMKSFGDQPTHDFSVGQVIAVAVAGTTILRGVWLFFRMFREKHGKVSPPSV